MSELAYRRAVPDDLPFLVGLIAADYVGPPDDDPAEAMGPEYLAALAEIDADRNQRLVVVEHDEHRVGMFQLTFIPGIMRHGMRRAVIEAVHIVPEMRNRGFGSEMIAHAIAIARENGCGLMQLTSNKARLDAHRFYRKLGFAQSHEGFKLYL